MSSVWNFFLYNPPILGQWSWTNIQTRYPSFQDDFSDGEIPIMFFWLICAMKRNFVKIYLTYNESAEYKKLTR